MYQHILSSSVLLLYWTKLLLLLKVLIHCFGNCRLLVVLQDKAYVYDIDSLTILDTIDTVPNLKGEVGIHFPPVPFVASDILFINYVRTCCYWFLSLSLFLPFLFTVEKIQNLFFPTK